MKNRIAQAARLPLILPSALAGCIATSDVIYAPKGDAGSVILGPSACRKLEDVETRQAALALANQALAAEYGPEQALAIRRLMKHQSFGQCGDWIRVLYEADPGEATGVFIYDVDLQRKVTVQRLDLDELTLPA